MQLWETLTNGGVFNPYAIGLGIGTIVLVLLLRKLFNKYKLPQMDMLLALIAATLVAASFHWSIPDPEGKTIVSAVGKVPAALPSFHIPEISFEWISKLLSGAIAISLLGLLEALAVAKSISTYTRQPLDYNRQCLAEGISNLGGGFFQCLPGSGSLTRSSINFQAGAITRMSGIYAGLIVAIVVLLFGPYARFIPKAALAGLLFVTAARLIDWKRLAYALRASWFDAALVLVTALSAIFISVDESILIGVGLSIVMFVPRASKLSTRELIVTPERIVREIQAQDQASNFVRIYDLEGELFFGAAPELDQTLDDIKKNSIQFNIKYLVLRFRRTRNPDVVAIEHLEHFLRDAEKNGITVFLAGVRPDLAKILKNTGLLSLLGKDHIYFEDDEQYSATIKAVRHVYKLLEQKNSKHETTGDNDESIYYLV